jgi:putative glycerol-1-phosphate prenyltransferase
LPDNHFINETAKDAKYNYFFAPFAVRNNLGWIMSIHESLLQFYEKKKAGYWVLLDPDKLPGEKIRQFVEKLLKSEVDAILIGGSLILNSDFEQFVGEVKKYSDNIPVLLFPGSVHQVTPKADALLFLSVISGRQAHNLIGNQVLAAPLVYRSGIEAISTAYMLIDSGQQTTAQFMSGSMPLPRNKPDLVVAHALAAQYLGFKIIYLEGGSGADLSVPDDIISAVRKTVDIPIIVGGGITAPQVAAAKVKAGATFIVTGNVLEKSDDDGLIRKFAVAVHS